MVTPQDIEQMTLQEALKYVVSDSPMVPGLNGRFEVLKIIYKALGFELTPDAVIMLLSETQYRLITAVAGAGKTTTTNIFVILFKFFWYVKNKEVLDGTTILYLVYNEHNTGPMVASHIDMVRKLKASGIADLNVDSNIRAMTVHAFCSMWMKEYATFTGYHKEGLIQGAAQHEMFKRAADILQIPEDLEVSYSKVESAYSFCVESMIPFDDPSALEKIQETKLDVQQFRMICLAYQNLKPLSKKFDFLDMPLKIIELMEQRPDAAARIRKYFNLFMADEGQDFTKLMMKLFSLISKGKPSFMAGDPDQTIYGFKGATVKSLLEYPVMFEGARIFTLNKNRRCSEAIVEAASVVIETNTDRFKTKIIPARPGGVVNLIGYQSEEGQAMLMVNRLKQLDPEVLDRCAVIYRNAAQSLMLVSELVKNNIEFKLVKGIDLFESNVFKHIFGILKCLMYPYVQSHQINMHKVLPIKSEALHNILGYDWKSRTFRKDARNFSEIDFGLFESEEEFAGAKRLLLRMSDVLDTMPMNQYFPHLFKMFRSYYWDNMMKRNREQLGEYLLNEAYNYFNTSKTFPQLFEEFSNYQEMMADKKNREGGLTLGTIHSVKGKQYDEVFFMYLDDNIIPSRNPANLDEVDLEAALAGELPAGGKVAEDETRLAYMGMTRAKYALHLYYSVDNPSFYAKLLLDYYKTKSESVAAATVEVAAGLSVSKSFGGIEVEDEVVEVPKAVPKTNKTALNRLFGGM